MIWLCFAFSIVMERRYPKEVQDLYETMRRFARIVGPVEHDKFIESHARRCFLNLVNHMYVCIIGENWWWWCRSVILALW